MVPSANCPMGSPSLLNGDFYENLAQLKDFSWSPMLAAVTQNRTSSSEGSVVDYVEKTLPVTAITLITTVIYVAIFERIINKCVSFLKVTRKMKVAASVCLAFTLTSFTISVAIFRMSPNIIPLLFLVIIYVHLLIIAFAFFDHCEKSVKAVWKITNFQFQCSIIMIVIIEILLFLFAPTFRPEPGHCPLHITRMTIEMFFYVTIIYSLLSYVIIVEAWTSLTADEFTLKENKKIIGKIVKKKDFGWITYTDEVEPLA